MTNNVVLVIVAHPDDETIGMGGTIKRHTDQGDEVFVVSMTNGTGSRDTQFNSNAKIRKINSQKASDFLKFIWHEQFDYEDNQMDKYPLLDIIKKIEKVKAKLKPELVYTHSPTDLNIDHRVLSKAVLTAFRPQPEEICKEIRLFEVPSATDYGIDTINGKFSPNLFISIDKESWNLKSKALDAYDCEIKSYPHSRSMQAIKNLAHIRGNQVGIDMAEAFQMIRKICN